MVSSRMHFANWLLHWAHRVPHFDFRFRRLHLVPFDMDPNGEYAQSLVLLCALSLLLALLLLLATVIVWISQCCLARRSRDSPTRASRRHIGRLSCALFLVSVLCFALMGACLYGNELLNKSVHQSASGLSHMGDAFRRAVLQSQKLNQSQWQLSHRIDELTVLIEQKSKEVNQTALIREADSLLTELSDKGDELKQRLGRTVAILADNQFLESAKRRGERVELERWLLCLLLPLIMLSVLFAGVVAFCRQSRKGAIIFSGLGLVIFLVAWLLFSAAFPLTVAFADFCSDGRPFLRTRINDELIDVVQFYGDCTPLEAGTEADTAQQQKEITPPALPLAMIGQLAEEQHAVEQKLGALLARVFNGSSEIETVSGLMSTQIVTSARLLGTLQATLQCSALHPDALAMRHGFCRHGFFGSALIAFALFLLGLTLFVLLILVSKSWYIFSRMPSDYLEVGEEDQFSPHGHDAMPDNIYDTNIFNPRARQHLANTAVTTHDGGPSGDGGVRLANGSGAATQSLLLNNSADGNTSWQQQLMAHNAAHASAPPPVAGGTLRLGTLTRNGGGIRTSSGNYQQLNGASSNPYARFQEFGDA